MELDSKQIDAVAELKRYGVKYTHTSDDWVKVHCPFHEDTSESCGINIRENYFKCHAGSCNTGGDIIAFLAGVLKTTRAVLMRDLISRYTLNDSVTIKPEVIERDHAHIWEHGPLLQELRNRAVTDDLIKKYRIGARTQKDITRITIPVKNEAGLYVNVRKYLPGAQGADKMRNETRCGRIRLFPIDQLSYDTIVICGGELKAIVAAAELNAHGIGAISTTAGEGNWNPDFTVKFTDKKVYVCYDIDADGRQGATNVCRYIRRMAKWCGLLELPLSIDDYPHGDINDFVATGGKLFPLLELVPEYQTRNEKLARAESIDPIPVALAHVLRPEFADIPLEFIGRVNAHGATFRVPAKLKPHCSKDQPCCSICPVFQLEDGMSFEIPQNNPQLLRYVNENKSRWLTYDKELLDIPTECHVVECERAASYTLQEIEVSESKGIGEAMRGFWFKPPSDAPITENYTFTGTVEAFPSNSAAVLYISHQELKDNEISEYKRPADNGEHLKIFRPTEWTTEALETKLNQIHDDIGNNALRVYYRNDMNLIADLSYHSVLEIPFDGKVVRGWVDVLIVGDSGQAKTSMLDGLIEHYGLGVKKDCKNASIPGLLATTRRGLSGQYIVSAGALPQNDRQLIVLEEFKGMQSDVMQKLTEVRSGGTLTVTKAAHGDFHARVRLIVMSNPKSTRPVGDYSFGVEILSELIPALEDIRRFDAAIILSKDDIDKSVLTHRRLNPIEIPHNFTSKLSRELIIWAWTRASDQIEISRESFGLILSIARKLQDEFTDELPLVDSTMPIKLTKLATALAARTFSTDETGERIIVRPCHVEFVAATLRRIYSQPAFGYSNYSASLKRIKDFQTVPVDEAIRDLALARTFVENTRHHDKISATDIGNWIGANDYSQTNSMISLLARCGAILRIENTAGANAVYTKTPQFNSYLKKVEHDKTLTNSKGPGAIQDDKF